MSTATRLIASLLACLLCAFGVTHAQWVEFTDATATRLVAPEELGALDVAEKDYAYGDVDRDGDIDLIVVRKQPHTTVGKRTRRARSTVVSANCPCTATPSARSAR